jgi:hypothetical protein
MQITNTYPKQTALAKQASLADQKNTATIESDRGSEQSDQVTGDSVQLSKEAVKLSLAPTAPGIAISTPIENGEQAQKTAEQVVSGFRDNPGLAQQIHGNLYQVNFKLLLE